MGWLVSIALVVAYRVQDSKEPLFLIAAGLFAIAGTIGLKNQ